MMHSSFCPPKSAFGSQRKKRRQSGLLHSACATCGPVPGPRVGTAQTPQCPHNIGGKRTVLTWETPSGDNGHPCCMIDSFEDWGQALTAPAPDTAFLSLTLAAHMDQSLLSLVLLD